MRLLLLLFTFLLMARKLYSFLLQGTEEIQVIYIGIFRAFCLLCQLMSCVIAQDYSAVPYCTTEKWFVHSFILFLLVNGVNTQQKISVTQVIRIKIRHQLIETQALHLTVTNYFNFCDSKYCFCICTQNFQFHKCSLVS